MGRCPFGYTAEDEEGEEEQLLEEPQENGENGSAPNKDDSKKKNKDKAPDAKDDPSAWFYQNQIKSEAEFKVKKDAERAEDRKRLEQIMERKNKSLVWPEGQELDDMSISSGELSELDSDVHSLASVRTCTYSWIESKRYKMPAETVTCWVASGTLVQAVVTMAIAAHAIITIRPVQGAVRNGAWAECLFLSALAVAVAAGCTLLAASWRSRKLLLAAQFCTLLAYGASVALVVAVSYLPTELDIKLHRSACAAAPKGAAPPGCDKASDAHAAVAHSSQFFKALTSSQGAACLALGAVGAWYLFELCYVEKKGAKHMRRHRRNKFTIPWDKIKIVGPPLPCGGGGAPPPKGRSAAGGGGKCPVSFS